MFLAITQPLLGMFPTLARHSFAIGIIQAQTLSALLVFQKVAANKTSLPADHEMIQVMAGWHQGDAASQHRFHRGPSPRLFKAVPERVDEQIEAVQKLQLRFL